MKCPFCKKEGTNKILYMQKKLFTDEMQDVSIYVCDDCYKKIENKLNNKISVSMRCETDG